MPLRCLTCCLQWLALQEVRLDDVLWDAWHQRCASKQSQVQSMPLTYQSYERMEIKRYPWSYLGLDNLSATKAELPRRPIALCVSKSPQHYLVRIASSLNCLKVVWIFPLAQTILYCTPAAFLSLQEKQSVIKSYWSYSKHCVDQRNLKQIQLIAFGSESAKRRMPICCYLSRVLKILGNAAGKRFSPAII